MISKTSTIIYAIFIRDCVWNSMIRDKIGPTTSMALQSDLELTRNAAKTRSLKFNVLHTSVFEISLTTVSPAK